VFVSSIDSSLPEVTLEHFLNYEAEGAPITWEVNDCGEQTGNPSADYNREFPMCVQAATDIKNIGALTIFVAVGTFRKGVFGAPALFSATIREPNGAVRSVRRLGDLPTELQRPLPSLPKHQPARK
jgi:hypothetical protein